MSRVERGPGEAPPGPEPTPPRRERDAATPPGFRAALAEERRRRSGKDAEALPGHAAPARAPGRAAAEPPPASAPRRGEIGATSFPDLTSALHAALELAAASPPLAASPAAPALGLATASAAPPLPEADADLDPDADPATNLRVEREVTAPHGRPGLPEPEAGAVGAPSAGSSAEEPGELDLPAPPSPGPATPPAAPPPPALGPPTPAPRADGPAGELAPPAPGAAAPTPPADDDPLRQARLGAGRAELVLGDGDDRLTLRISAGARHVRIEAVAASAELATAFAAGTAELRHELARHGLALAALSAETSAATGGGHHGPGDEPRADDSDPDGSPPGCPHDATRAGVRAVA
jgi:hypothetical protein